MIFNQIPTEVIINDEVYEIKIVKKPGNSKNLHGIIFYNEKIELGTHLKGDLLESTLIHEMLHGVSRHYALRLCEGSIEKLEKGIFELFKKNGWKITVV